MQICMATGVAGIVEAVLVDEDTEGEGEAVMVALAFGVVMPTAKNIAAPLKIKIIVTASILIHPLPLL